MGDDEKIRLLQGGSMKDLRAYSNESVFARIARHKKMQFDAYIEAGFTIEQALALIK